MSMQKVLVSVPSLRPAPRGAVWVGQAASWLQEFHDEVRALIAATAEASRKRAAEDREARSRAELIEMARRYQGTQPEFAKDLFAAASNHRAS
jgi:surfactin synthase thioesterase subunit